MQNLSFKQPQQTKIQSIQRKSLPLQAQKQQTQQQIVKSNKITKVAQIIAGCAATLTALPVFAEQSAEELMQSLEGPGHLFDFDLTLPVIAAEFLLLMVFLSKTWFGPVGKVLDDRDKLIRDRLASVRGGGNELQELQKGAEQVMKDAFLEAQNVLNAARSQAQEESNKQIEEAKKVQDRELEQALGRLETEKDQATKALDKQVEKLSQEILRKILPKEVQRV